MRLLLRASARCTENLRGLAEAALAYRARVQAAHDALERGEPVSDMFRAGGGEILTARRDLIEAISAAQTSMTATWGDMLRVMVDAEGMSQAEAGRLLGLDRHRAHRYRARALRKREPDGSPTKPAAVTSRMRPQARP